MWFEWFVSECWWKSDYAIIKGERPMCHIRSISQLLMIILLLYVEAHIFILKIMEKLGICYRIMPCSTIIHALISCRLDYCNSLLYNVPTHKTDRLQRLQNQCARILTKSPRIMPPISKDCSNTFLERFIYLCSSMWMEQIEWMYSNVIFWFIQEECYLHNNMGAEWK